MYTNNKAIGWPITSTTVQIVHSDGKLEEFKHQVKASQILSQNPNSFLCSSESMLVGARAQQLGPQDTLHPTQIYFLIPLSEAKTPLSLHRLCSLAITASDALSGSDLDSPSITDCGFHGWSLPVLPKA